VQHIAKMSVCCEVIASLLGAENY